MGAVASEISGVKLYHEGATVMRSLSVGLGAQGFPGQVEVSGLPLAAEDATLRIRVLSVEPPTAALTVRGLQVGLHAPPPEAVPEPPDVKELRALQQKLDKERRQLAQLEAETALLEAIAVPSRPQAEEGKPPPASPMLARLALARFVDGGVEERLGEQRSRRRLISELERELRSKQDQVARAKSVQLIRKEEVTKTVLAELQSSRDEQRSTCPAAVIVLTDGHPTAGISNPTQLKHSLGSAHAELGFSAPMFTFGFGEDHNSMLLTELAEGAEGMYSHVEDAEMIASSFAECLGGITSLVAQVTSISYIRAAFNPRLISDSP